jgi:hypothetical protein
MVVGLKPTPTVPFARTVRRDAPEEDATLNGLMPGFPCTLRLNDEDDALTPRTVPLSIRVEVLRDVGVSQRVAQPDIPPETTALIFSDDVDTQSVDVPVD